MGNGLLVVASTIFSYFLFELVFYLALCFGVAAPVHPYYTYTAWTNPSYVTADPVIGIRLQPAQPNDGIRVIQGDVQFYYTGTKANSAGFFSDHEYVPRKRRSYRIAVYGSSLVSMLYQTGTWVDRLNDILEKSGIEVYNFSFDGGSPANWNAHYFHELTTTYDFDMVVFAVTAGDIAATRFAVSETRPEGYFFNNFSEPPRNVDDLNRNYRPALHRIFGMADRRFLGDLNEHFTRHQFLMLPFDFYALKSLRLAILGDHAAPIMDLSATDQSKHHPLLDSMLDDIRLRGKQAVLVLLPISPRISSAPDVDVEQSRAVAEISCIAFIDGRELFRKFLTPAQISDSWPRYEAHWFKRGGDRFAELLAPELVRVRAQYDIRPNAAGSCQ